MEQIKKQFGLEDYDILGYSLKSKQERPIVCIICKKNHNYYMIKAAFEPENEVINKQFKKEYQILKDKSPLILDPKLIKGNYLRTRYIFAPSLSYFMNNLFGSKKYIDLAIKWLVDFHNEDHKNSIGHIHGDFSPHDIIILNGEVIVFDWEDYEKNCNQLIDIYYFIYRSIYSYMILDNREKNNSEFVNMIIGDKKHIHPFLKKYMELRNIDYSIEKRKKALNAFFNQRLKKENELFSIPKRDRFIYRNMKNLLSTEKNKI